LSARELCMRARRARLSPSVRNRWLRSPQLPIHCRGRTPCRTYRPTTAAGVPPKPARPNNFLFYAHISLDGAFKGRIYLGKSGVVRLADGAKTVPQRARRCQSGVPVIYRPYLRGVGLGPDKASSRLPDQQSARLVASREGVQTRRVSRHRLDPSSAAYG
jgi:hypothetical protein